MMSAPKQIRDKTSSAVLNTDGDSLKQYKAARAKAAEQKLLVKDVEEIKQRLDNIENMAMQSLALTQEILNKLNG